MSNVVVAALDVGSLANIGWWRAAGTTAGGGRDLDELVAVLTADLNLNRSVALGFEAPTFVPLPADAASLCRQRVGDRGRPWSAGAGTGALALGVQQAAYVFAKLARRLATLPRISFDPLHLNGPETTLCVWEAFVSGNAKNRAAVDPHMDDARVAVNEFSKRLAKGAVHSDIDEPSVLNLAAGALLASGLTTDTDLLTRSVCRCSCSRLHGAARLTTRAGASLSRTVTRRNLRASARRKSRSDERSWNRYLQSGKELAPRGQHSSKRGETTLTTGVGVAATMQIIRPVAHGAPSPMSATGLCRYTSFLGRATWACA